MGCFGWCVKQPMPGSLLGTGTFSKVELRSHPDHGRVAVKQYVLSDRLMAKREWNMLRACSHENVVRCFDMHVLHDCVELELEYVDSQTLTDAIMDRRCPSREGLIDQLLTVVEYLHTTVRVAHLDLKADNVMLTKEGCLKLIDFNLAYRYNLGEPEVGFFLATGTIVYTAPDVLRGRPTSAFKNDVWSVGVLIFCMIAGHFPFEVADETCPFFTMFLMSGWTNPSDRLRHVHTSCHFTVQEGHCLDLCLVAKGRDRANITAVRNLWTLTA